MLNGLSADGHGVGHAIERSLHFVEDAFMLPALESLVLRGRAFALERASRTGRKIAVVVDVVMSIGARLSLGQAFAGRAGIVIVFRVINEISNGEEAKLVVAGGHCLGNAGQDASSFASQHLLAAIIASVSQHGDFFAFDGLEGFATHKSQLRPVRADVGDFVRDDEMMLGVNSDLDIVADDAGAFAAGRHRAGVGIGERNLFVGCRFHLPLHLFERLHLPA